MKIDRHIKQPQWNPLNEEGKSTTLFGGFNFFIYQKNIPQEPEFGSFVWILTWIDGAAHGGGATIEQARERAFDAYLNLIFH